MTMTVKSKQGLAQASVPFAVSNEMCDSSLTAKESRPRLNASTTLGLAHSERISPARSAASAPPAQTSRMHSSKNSTSALRDSFIIPWHRSEAFCFSCGAQLGLPVSTLIIQDLSLSFERPRGGLLGLLIFQLQIRRCFSAASQARPARRGLELLIRRCVKPMAKPVPQQNRPGSRTANILISATRLGRTENECRHTLAKP